MNDDTSRERWGRRPVLALAVRTLVFLVPVAASFGVAALVRPLLPSPSGFWGHLGYLLVLVAVSTVTLVVVDRVSRRALPLATLLDLSMLFPDQAPSRLRLARDASKRAPIEEQLARVARAGADPGAVAREILTLVAALSAHDRPTRGHAERVRMFTDLLAAEMRISERDRDLLRWAALLHDVGKLQIPTSLLNKPAKPTPEEWVVLRAHPAHGAEIAGALLPWLGEWGAVIVEHHERYDGTGYPLGIAGREISLGARIVSVADAFDVMTAARAYQRPVSRAAAYRELIRFSGTQFDPVVVRAMVSVGAPRLRRAQGALAWLADLPLVASASVPAATVARVVGAGALATGAVAGGAGLGTLPEPHPRSQIQVLDVAERPGGPVPAPEGVDRPRAAHPASTDTRAPKPAEPRSRPTSVAAGRDHDRPTSPGNSDAAGESHAPAAPETGSGSGSGHGKGPSGTGRPATRPNRRPSRPPRRPRSLARSAAWSRTRPGPYETSCRIRSAPSPGRSTTWSRTRSARSPRPSTTRSTPWTGSSAACSAPRCRRRRTPRSRRASCTSPALPRDRPAATAARSSGAGRARRRRRAGRGAWW